MSFRHTIGRREVFNLIRKLLKLLETDDVYSVSLTFASDGVHVEESG